MPKVSIIMPMYNQENYIRECLESVINQTLKDIEIIVVNDGSKDKSLEIVQEYAKKDPRIIIIDKPNTGYGDSMNVGINRATGEYIGIVETDDFVALDMYEILYDIARKRKIDIVKADFARFEVKENELIKQRERIAPKNYCNRILHPDRNIRLFHLIKMNTWAGIYNTEWLRKNNIRHNETPGASFQDNGFWFQTMMHAREIYLYDGKPLYFNRRDNPNSSVYSKNKVFCNCEEYKFIEHILKENDELFDKYKYIFQFKKFTNYLWHLRRIATFSPEWSEAYLENFYKEFKVAEEMGLLDKETFDSINSNYWELLTELLEAPACLIDVEKEKQYLLSKLFFLEPAYQENSVVICFASDENYAPMLSVAINSIIKSSSYNVNYDIIILEEELSDKIKNAIVGQAEGKSNISIRFYNMRNLMKLYSCQDL